MGRPITVQVGPLIAGSATEAALSQKAARSGTNYLVLNGASGSFTANSVCASQTPSGAGALTINGTLASSVPTGSAVAYLGTPTRIYITGGSDESGKTFTVVGTTFSAGGGPTVVTEVITGPNASTVSSLNQYYTVNSITASAGTTGAITVGNYGTVTLDNARQILFTPAGDDSAIKYTITGTDWYGANISETVAGVANPTTATTALDYKTITSISTSGAVASTITVGTNGVGHSPWVRFDDYASNSQTTVAAIVSGTVNYDIQSSMNDPNANGDVSYGNPALANWLASLDTNVVGATASKSSYFTYTPIFARVILNSGSGSVTTTFRQAYTG